MSELLNRLRKTSTIKEAEVLSESKERVQVDVTEISLDDFLDSLRICADSDDDIIREEFFKFSQKVKSFNKETPFYTYVLCFPDGTPFYIGKGKDLRGYSHIKEATNKNEKRNLKLSVIRNILHSNSYPIVHIIEGDFPESDALKLEDHYIHEYGKYIDGSGILTNIKDSFDNLPCCVNGGKLSALLKFGMHGASKEKRIEWAKLGAFMLEKSGNRSGIYEKFWRENNKEFVIENASKGGRISGKIVGRMLWWNDGIKNAKSYTSPGEGWVRGMLMSEKKRAQVQTIAGHNRKKLNESN